jgi:hypothetical protein
VVVHEGEEIVRSYVIAKWREVILMGNTILSDPFLARIEKRDLESRLSRFGRGTLYQFSEFDLLNLTLRMWSYGTYKIPSS